MSRIVLTWIIAGSLIESIKYSIKKSVPISEKIQSIIIPIIQDLGAIFGLFFVAPIEFSKYFLIILFAVWSIVALITNIQIKEN
jgi:hypothetical protein